MEILEYHLEFVSGFELKCQTKRFRTRFGMTMKTKPKHLIRNRKLRFVNPTIFSLFWMIVLTIVCDILWIKIVFQWRLIMYTIKEVAEKMDVSEHTLRFWAKSGFFPFIKRNENNIRLFSDSDLDWVKIVKCLRSVGTENKAIKRYIDLCIIGDSTIPERYQIILATKERAKQQMVELQKQLELLDFKENFYQNLIKNNLKDSWNPMNNRDSISEKAV